MVLCYDFYSRLFSRTASIQSQCLFAFRFTMSLEYTASVRKQVSCFSLKIRIPSMIESHLSSWGTSPSDTLTIRKTPPARKVRYTSRKLSAVPGQKYTVSKAVAKSSTPSSKGRWDTSPCILLQGQGSSYGEEVATLVEYQAQEFVNDMLGALRERQLDLRTGRVIFVGGGACLLRRQIETSGKVAHPVFVEDVNANAKGFEYLYRCTVTGE